VARKFLSFIYFLAFPAAGILMVLAPPIIRVLSGPGFEEAVLSMRIASVLVVLMGITNFVGLQVLLPDRGEGKLLAATAAGASVNLALNFLLIPRFAQHGAAAALIAAETSSAIVLGLMSRGSRLGFRLMDGIALRYAAMALPATVAASAAGQWAAPDLLLLPAAFAAGAGVYLGGLAMLRDPLLLEIAAMAGARLKVRHAADPG
jgi:O-antigen/teichoic acid export membrane protein